MLQPLRRVYRRFFPRLHEPLLDAPLDTLGSDVRFAGIYQDLLRVSEPHVYAEDFVRCRYEEGRRWRSVMRHYFVTSQRRRRILDIGAGNGAIELAFAADGQWTVFSVENTWNDTFRRLRDSAAAKAHRVMADAASLPFHNGSFAAVTCLETVEHLRQPRLVAAEIRRVVALAGVVLLTTPPRLRYVLRRDPHFGMPGLVLLPASLQRLLARKRGFTRPDQHVDRIYASVPQVLRLLEGFRLEAVLSRSRAPRRWFWDAIVLRKC